MPSTMQLMTAIAPARAAQDSAPVFLSLAAQQLDPESWGAVYQQGVVFLALHMMETADPEDGSGASAAGPVAARKAGDVSVSYAQLATSPADVTYTTTRWGRQFLELKRQAVHCPVAV